MFKPKLIHDAVDSYWRAIFTNKDVKCLRYILAYARSNAKDQEPEKLPEIIAKCIFISLLGENTDFAQIHVVNLMSQNKFSSKLMAYLAAEIFMDQSGDISVLLTQTILNDLSNPDPKIVSLACRFIANTNINELLQNCAPKIEKLIEHENLAVSKNAAAAAIKIVEVCPDFHQLFIPHLANLIGSNHHCLVSLAANLALRIYPHDPENQKVWEKLTTVAIDYITSLVKFTGTKSTYFSGGYEDPFMHIHLLRLLQTIATPSKELDSLFLLIMNTVDLSRACGRSILLQVIQVIQKHATADSVRKTIINQIGKMLYIEAQASVIYSALSAFTKILYRGNEIINRKSAESEVLSRHKDIIIKLLEHSDPSIRRRALDLITALVNQDNIEELLPKILKFIRYAESDFRSTIIFKLFYLVQNFAPSMKWNIDFIIQLMISSESYISNEIIIKFTEQIGRNQRIQEYAIGKLETVLQENTTNQPIVQVASFVIGEFANVYNENFLPTIMQIAKIPQTTHETISYILTAVAKYAFRFQIVDQSIFNFYEQFLKSDIIEIQQRAGELGRILSNPQAAEELLSPIIYEGEVDEESAITPYKSDLTEVIMSMQRQAKNRRYSEAPQTKNDIIGALLGPVNIVPPKGAHEVLTTNDIVIYFEISKNHHNLKQFAIRSSIFNRVSYNVISNFKIKYGVPHGWIMQCKDQDSHELLPDGNPLQNIIMLENKGTAPLAMKVMLNYSSRGQNLHSIENLKPLHHLITVGLN